MYCLICDFLSEDGRGGVKGKNINVLTRTGPRRGVLPSFLGHTQLSYQLLSHGIRSLTLICWMHVTNWFGAPIDFGATLINSHNGPLDSLFPLPIVSSL